jgi:hypothetical protein
MSSKLEQITKCWWTSVLDTFVRMTRYNISFSRVLRKDTKWVTKQVEIQENDEIEEDKKAFGMNKHIEAQNNLENATWHKIKDPKTKKGKHL